MKTLLCLLSLSLTVACSSQKDTSDTSKDALMDEVMQLHDEAMIPWGEIHALNNQLSAKIEELDSLHASSEAAQKYQQISQSLEEADEAMMEWMRAFRPDELQEMAADSAIAVLREKKASMEKVYDLVHNSVDSAKALLGTE